MVRQCYPPYEDPNCLLDRLNSNDIVRLENFIEGLVDIGNYDDARKWVSKVKAADETAYFVVMDYLKDSLTYVKFMKLTQMPDLPIEVFDEKATEERAFKRWMEDVNKIVEAKLGVSVYELPDMNYRDYFDEFVTAEDFVREDLLPEVGADFGYDFSEDFE
jgi:hypothetical protein